MTEVTKFQILNRFSGSIIFECEISAEVAILGIGARLGFAVKKAIEVSANLSRANLSRADLSRADLSDANLSRADLSRANLSDANLSRADLSRADLSRADLRSANLSRADLSDANLSDANLSRADLSDANLSRANLSRADLSRANLSRADLSDANLSDANLSRADLRSADLRSADLRSAKNDVFDILLRAIPEVPALLDALRAGKIDGSVYEGDCACLCGTIANVRGINYRALGFADSYRPAERWFLGIKKGDTPENSSVAKITEGWIVEFQQLIAAGTVPASA
ncbi:pentapeptide repeat-containing protein [Acidisoma cellulosilytica]|uniref:Pentapeptide repeat-containing protein n=1 Tax=Acidisoma cellulosilyticum TaxID=2802395 RepID=A0A963YZT1_9PROT|nr:pentapeptide repeat-containing protein [Acidisoma cellulosilyticum]MCB8880084.1 pentapeptide repeat-containing protein [Acidisoma cellulosilyticum]